MSFDIDTYQRLSQKLEIGDIDFETFRSLPLQPDVLRCLRYMHDVENHTVCYLRDVLVTRAHRDPEVRRSSHCGTTRSSGTVRPLPGYWPPMTSRPAPGGSPPFANGCPSAMRGDH